MSRSENFTKYAVLAAVGLGAGIVLWQAFGPDSAENGQTVAVTAPQLSPQAAQGKIAFDAACAACHGTSAAGSGKGPPLVHNIYNPGHHADAAFYLAARRGVRQHHWQFGNMPPQPQVSDEEMALIIEYVRELQRANGIVGQQHQM